MSEPARISDLNELHPLVKKQAEAFLKACADEGLNIKITETYRSQERQNYLYEQGRTRPGNIVTWTKTSNHTNRRAFDICHNVRGDEYNSAVLRKAGAIGKRFGLDWGGDWKSPDSPHFENQSLNPMPVDVNKPSAWAENAWAEMKQLGILDGTRPKDTLTREEFAVCMSRILQQIKK